MMDSILGFGFLFVIGLSIFGVAWYYYASLKKTTEHPRKDIQSREELILES